VVRVESLLKIIDNSGGFWALCVRILTNSKLGRPGDEVVIAIKTIILNKKVIFRKRRKVFKGTVRRAVLLRVSYSLKRWGNVYLKMTTSSVALVGRWETPVASRIYGPIYFEARVSKFIKIAMLSEGSY
jgi:ribosomal protein L14